MKVTTILTVAALAAALGTTDIHAYATNGWWNQNTVGMHASAASFPPGNSFRNSMPDTFSRFNDNPSEFRLNINFGDNSVSRANWQSEIWATNNWKWGSSPAVELSRYGLNGRIKASDIIFKANHNWTSSVLATNVSAYGGGGRSFRSALMHELGHTAGLAHEGDEYNIMGEDHWHMHRWRNQARTYLGEDASDGLVAIYGRKSGASIEDLSVAHFKRIGTLSGGYSDHFRTKMANAGGSELNYTAFSGMRRYNVSKGQQVQVEFSYENNGETTKNGIAIGFYISTNDLVTTGDQLIATRVFNLSPDNVATRWDTLTIPNNLNSGQTYYLGVVIDRTNAFGEVDEDNNRAFHVIRVN